MDATTTLSIKRKFNQIKDDYDYGFKLAERFYWSSSERVIYHSAIKNSTDLALILHEIAHAELKHSDYNFDIELVRMEAAAWETANILSKKYELQISNELIQDSLDTYRSWIHSRSLCPDCSINGIQINQNAYSCINCRRSWRVNNSLFCRLRRLKQPIRSQI